MGRQAASVVRGDLTMRLRRDEPGYFVVIDAEGKEVTESRRRVPEGRGTARDDRIVAELRGSMGPDCDVVFKPDGGLTIDARRYGWTDRP